MLWIAGYVLWRGFVALLALAADTSTSSAIGGLSGLGQATAGSALLIVAASAVAVPIGIGAGATLSDAGRTHRAARALRMVVAVLSGTPSIVVGVFVFVLLVRPTGRYSMVAGMLALAILMAPRVARSTEEALQAVPVAMREAAHAMGATRWQVLLSVSLRAARSAIVAGVLFALARVGGETAPLLVTSRALEPVSSDAMQSSVTLNVAALDLAVRADPQGQHLAWASALVLMLGVVAAAVAGRLLARRAG